VTLVVVTLVATKPCKLDEPETVRVPVKEVSPPVGATIRSPPESTVKEVYLVPS